MEEAWFAVSSAGSIVTVISASIAIIQFSRNYKSKSPAQSAIFLLAGILLLCLGLYLNIIVLEFGGEYVTVPRMLLCINSIFALYALYTGAKRVFRGKLI